jgi:hypothetical protein
MRKKASIIAAGLCLFVVFFLISSGCAWITFTAQSRVQDKIMFKSSKPVHSVYLELLPSSGDETKACERVMKTLNKLMENQFTLLSSPQGADLIMKLKIHRFTKKEGTQYFFLGFIPISGIESGVYSVEGLKVSAEYTTDRGRWHKTYLAYHENMNSDEIVCAIISDLSQLTGTKRTVDKKQ